MIAQLLQQLYSALLNYLILSRLMSSPILKSSDHIITDTQAIW